MAAFFCPLASVSFALFLLIQATARADEPQNDDAARDPRRAQVIASGKGFAITVGDLEDHINQQPVALRARYTQPEQRKELLSELLRLELLAAEAERRGFAQNLAVRKTVKDGAVQALMRIEIDEKISPDTIRADEINAFYAEHATDFHHPAQRRASQIALASREAAAALLPDAQKADLRGFSELARKHSIDPETKLRGGDLSFFTLEPRAEELGRALSPALRKAIFALKEVGDTSSTPIEHDGEFSIVRLTGERPERHITLAEAESSIRSRLWRERRQNAVQALLSQLRQREKPEVFAERVDLVKFDDMDKRPPGFAPDPPRQPFDAAASAP